MVFLLGQTFGLAAEDVRPTLDEPTYHTVLRETVEAECQLAGDPDDWPSPNSKRWRQLILGILRPLGQMPQGIDSLPGRSACSLTSEVDRKIAEGDLIAGCNLVLRSPIRGTWFLCVAAAQ